MSAVPSRSRRRALLIATFAAFAMPAVSATPAATAPTVSIAPADGHSLGLVGAPNFRDLGGYRAADGRMVQRGIVYRSSKLAPLTPADWTRVKALGIGHVYDLRTVAERKAEPDGWPPPAPPATVSPKPDLAAAMAGLRDAGADADAVRAAIRRFYADMPTDYAPEYAAFFRGVANGDAPVAVHCTAGKDRTGVAAALLLTALGVPRPVVIDDYALTGRLLPREPMRTSNQPGAPPPPAAPSAAQQAVWAADPAYVEAALDAITRRYGSIEGYMRVALGMDDVEIARLRRRLLD